jgi:hypothetical protein
VLADESRECFCERCVADVKALEIEQLGGQCAGFAVRDSEREQHQEGVRAGLLDHDSAFIEEAGHQRGGDATLLELSFGGDPWCEDRDLDRVEHHVAVPDPLIAVPGVAVAQNPALGIALLGRRALRGAVRLPRAEAPVIRGGSELAAEGERLIDRVVDQSGSLRAVHHPRGDVERGDDPVLGGGGGVHHERLPRVPLS